MSTPQTARTVLVTGAARRLGREIALGLARAGWQVAIHYRDSREEARATSDECAALSGSSASFKADLSSEAAVRKLVPRVAERFGRLDALVNNASTFEHDTPSSFGFAAMEKHMRSNTGAAILLAQALADHVAAQRPEPSGLGAQGKRAAGNQSRAVVVNLLDQKLWNQNPDFFSYTLSKAALEAATTMLALSLAPHVRVLGVAPGLTLTSPLLNDKQFKARHQMALLGQSSTPQDVAATVRFALENQSLTGTTLVVDGGQHLMRFERDFSLM